MSDGRDTALELGRQAMARAAWADAREAFRPLLDDDSPEALEGYGLASWFVGEMELAIELRQRACLAYGARGECDQAARLAVWVSHQYLISGRASLANGWLARAERALEDHAECAGAGWVAVEQARRAGVAECIEHATRALELGRHHQDDDLEVFALTVLGQAEIAAGRFDDGMRTLEEAMAAATAGKVGNPHTLGEAYCNMIAASTSAGDWERASEWCDLVTEHARSRSIVPLFGACRATHAEVLAAAGRWHEAETALVEALTAHQGHYAPVRALTAAALARLRVRQGRLADARELLAGREERPDVLQALGELRLAEAEPAVAVPLLERALAGAGDDLLAASRVLVPLVDARLAIGDVPEAAAAVGALRDLANSSERPLVAARAALAASRLALAEDDLTRAHEEARLALDTFGRLSMPHDAAEARLVLARALARDHPGLALEEGRAALATFRGLGATRSHDEAAAALRQLGAGSAAGLRTDGVLTERELQVLALLADGLTNAQIGASLFISEKTVGHHVSRILMKLGVRNRAEAAAQASRFSLPGATPR